MTGETPWTAGGDVIRERIIYLTSLLMEEPLEMNAAQNHQGLRRADWRPILALDGFALEPRSNGIIGIGVQMSHPGDCGLRLAPVGCRQHRTSAPQRWQPLLLDLNMHRGQ